MVGAEVLVAVGWWPHIATIVRVDWAGGGLGGVCALQFNWQQHSHSSACGATLLAHCTNCGVLLLLLHR